MNKYVYFFGNGKSEGDKGMKFILGGKGANLAEMTNLGIPVPPGFTISTEVCRYYYSNDKKYPVELKAQIAEGLKKMEMATGKKFGDAQNPLLVSVRSGAAASMPGMMDTILNLGLNEKVVEGMVKKTGNARFVWDSYRRFVQMYSNVVGNLEHEKFEHVINKVKAERGIKEDTQMTAEDWQKVVKGYKEIYKIEKGKDFPEDSQDQLDGAIGAVFGSWNNPRAIIYRQLNKIDESKIFVTGNTIVDAIQKISNFKVNFTLNLPDDKKIITVTAHRRENIGQPLESICTALRRLCEDISDVSIIYPVHLNPVVRETANRILGGHERIHLIDPLNVQDMHNLMNHSTLIMTDSGGLQEEAPSLGKPVLVLRNETERPGFDGAAARHSGPGSVGRK